MRSQDLYGNAPDKCPVALLLIDVINDLDFPEGRQLLEQALPMADKIQRLAARARRARVPVVYVNDNFGRWRSDFRTLVEHCLAAGGLGRPMVEKLRPQSDDYFVLKPAHSGFFSTSLDLLLRHLQVKKVIVTGVATDICVLFTANDAYLHGFDVVVPEDCVASNAPELSGAAIAQMKRVLKADVRPSAEQSFPEVIASSDGIG